MKRSVDSTPTDMMETESFKRFIEGLRVAASCAKEMTALDPKAGWGKVHEALINLIAQGRKLAQTKALTRQALLSHADQIQSRLDPVVR